MIVSKQYSDYVSPLESSMSSYPNILTPPSSSEDSPQSVYLVASPTSNTFEYENYQLSPLAQAPFIMEQQVMIDPNHVNIHPQPEQDVLLHFIEQPTDRFRFRYKSEMAGTHGSLTGINSDKSRKPTYPTVELKNCSSSLGRVIVRCSIYQSNAAGKDMLPHAHRLIMKKGKEEHDDPHDIVIGPEDGYRAVFQGMGIIHTAKKNIVTELTRKKMQLKREAIARAEGKIRELITKEQVEIKGLAESESKSINLNIVCLRFDAFIRDRNILYPICEPIFSHGINNLKSALTGDLKIVRLDHVISPAKGNKEIFILVERVTKKNIRIRFYEVDDEDKVVWEDWGRFNDLDVHHQYAIVFKTPKYHDENITSPVHVLIELYRPSDGARSEPRDFRYIPNFKTGNKRPRYDYSSSSYNSSNMDSDELPVPINNLHIEQHKANPTDGMSLSFPSEELNRALNNIDSNEFKKLFSENEQAYDTLEFDAPRTREQPYNRVETAVAEMGEERFVPSRRTPQLINIKMEKMEVSNEDRQMANKDIAELRSFIRTTHKPQIAMKILKHYFGEDEKTNALHVSVSIGDNNSAELLLKIIAYYRQFEILEKSNNAKQTPLHLAILTCNKQMVSYLILCKARICSTDSDLNTALHLAILKNVAVNILELLLKRRDCEETGEFIDMENKQGNTALVIAIEKNNMVAIKLLCRAGADLNKIHPKNGYVPLRFAVEKKQADIVRYFLTFNSLNPTVKDFQNISPLTAALAKEDSEEIVRIVKKYMADNNLPVEVKEEPEDDSEEEMEIDEEVDVKTEFPQLSSEELEKLYKDVTNFTPQCLDEVSSILDKTENWKCLAELLEIEHLVNSEIITSDLSMSKAVLVYSIETNHDSIWMIRNFLENLDEFRAVELIDRMVQEIKKS